MEPIASAATIGTTAVAAGVLVGAVAHAPRRLGWRIAIALGAPIASVVLAAVGGEATWNPWRALPTPIPAALAAAGLFLLGVALAPRRSSRAGQRRDATAGAAASRAGACLLLALLLDHAATGWSVLEPEPAWSPRTTARLLDASPRAFVLESGGVDWMRHPSVYDAAGTDRIGPGIRTGRRGSVAAALVLVLGCVAAGARLVRRSR
ncbi:MAG: hypothetical protein AAGA20_21835 [Planctomycetota bacterium]